jgi:hypothetical protein
MKESMHQFNMDQRVVVEEKGKVLDEKGKVLDEKVNALYEKYSKKSWFFF